MDPLTPMRIVVADSQSDVRYALRVLLQLVRELHVEVIAEVMDADGLYRVLSSRTADLLLLDWSLPDLPQERRLQVVREKSPGMRIIVLSGRPEVQEQVLASGADAFVSKIDSVGPLINAIRSLRATT
ncbi:MAG: response regulator [Anaerolineae bacterium]|nr:response regulator [Anaerolineae bacterium]